MIYDTEHTAWLWLLALPRLEIPDDATGPQWRELCDCQVKITLCPGKLHANCGAPMVEITILLPGLKKRVRGSGNNLYSACDRAQQAAGRAGVQLPFLTIFDLQRKREPGLTVPKEV